MALVYLINKPQLSRRIAKWVLLFLEYEFTIIYKLSRTHVVTNILSRLPYSSNPLGVLDQIVSLCRCIIILCGTYMDARSKELLGDMLDVRNSKPSS